MMKAILPARRRAERVDGHDHLGVLLRHDQPDTLALGPLTPSMMEPSRALSSFMPRTPYDGISVDHLKDTKTRYQGIYARHQLGCAIDAGRSCNCTPSYWDQVWDRAVGKARKTKRLQSIAAARVEDVDLELGVIYRWRGRADLITGRTVSLEEALRDSE